MEINWENIKYLALAAGIASFIGTFLGFLSAVGIEYLKKYLEKKKQKEKTRSILKALKREIEEGISRSKGLIGFLNSNKVSFSRIYTGCWASTNSILHQNYTDVEILNILHGIYYRFDLINFNMEQGRPGPGAAFAKTYIDEMEKNFETFKNKISSY